MLEILKSNINSFRTQSQEVREKERHYLTNNRNLRGNFPKKHKIDGQVPNATEKQVKASQLENAIDLADEDLVKFFNLHRFRVNVLRKEARDTQLAYGFLKGIAFATMEQRRYTNPDFVNIERIVMNNTDEDERVVQQRYAEWVAMAKQTLPINWISKE